MAFANLCCLLVLATAQATKHSVHFIAHQKEAPGDNDKTAAVDKVITLMESTKAKVIEEGESEAKAYNKFAWFVKDTQKEKADAIQKGKDDASALAANNLTLNAKRADLVKTIADTSDDITEIEGNMKRATATRKATSAEYAVNIEDMSSAIYALEGAIQALKASKPSGSLSLVQFQHVAKTLQTAMSLADALGLIQAKEKDVAVEFLQRADIPQPEMENYKFKSGGVIELLEKLLKQFSATKVDLDSSETASMQAYEMKMQEWKNTIMHKENEISRATADRDATSAAIAQSNEELSVVSASLLEDQQYLSELNALASGKAKTYEQRIKLREDEISTLTTVIGILKDMVKKATTAATVRLVQQSPGKIMFGALAGKNLARSESAMEALEARAEAEEAQGSPVGFLQRQQTRLVPKHARMPNLKHSRVAVTRLVQEHTKKEPNMKNGLETVTDMLSDDGSRLKSTLLTALASQLRNADGPFDKVKDMIQKLVERLLAEQASEATKKGTCDKDISDATMKRDFAAEKASAANAELAESEAKRESLTNEIETLSTEIAELKKSQGEQSADRAAETKTNKETVASAKLGLEAIEEVLDIMVKFYKVSAKATVASFAQQGPSDDAPDAGFENNEAYQGAQAESGGIIGMMDVIKADFKRTIAETEEDEAKAEADHKQFMSDTTTMIQSKEINLGSAKKIRKEVIESIGTAKQTLDTEMIVVKSQLEMLVTYKARCIDTGMSVSDRFAKREGEVESLKKALCILESYTDFAKGGLPLAAVEC